MTIRYAAIAATVLLSACGGGSTTPPAATLATERAIIVPINGANVRVLYDTANAAGTAKLTYEEPVPTMAGWLNFNRDVIPAVEQATGCSVIGARPADNQIMGDMGVTMIPLGC